MGLQEQIKNDLKTAMKERDEDKKNAIRVIMGEFGRMENKSLSDDAVIQVLKKLVKSEKELLEKTGRTEASPFIRIVSSYLPQQAGEDEIRQWIQDNVDFSAYKNKMQAMREIMSHFGSGADGSLVKKVLQAL